MTAPSNVSREQRAAWGRLGGLTGAAKHTAEERRQYGSIGGKGRAAKYTSEQLRQIYANQLRTRFSRMTPEQAREFQRKAGQGRWRGVTADEQSKIQRKAIERRWGQVAYAKNQEKADRLYAFLREYISVKRCAPTLQEMCHAMHQDVSTAKRLLQILERIGRIQRHPWGRGITLAPLGDQPPAVAHSSGGESTVQGSAVIVVPRQTKKCYQCDDPAVAGKTRCERHLHLGNAASNRSQKSVYAHKKLNALCVNCAEPAVKGKVRCERHLRLRRAAQLRCRTVSSPPDF